jgi:hypothetical protein
MEPEDSFSCSQEPTTGTYQSQKTMDTFQSYFPLGHFNMSFPSVPRYS